MSKRTPENVNGRVYLSHADRARSYLGHIGAKVNYDLQDAIANLRKKGADSETEEKIKQLEHCEKFIAGQVREINRGDQVLMFRYSRQETQRREAILVEKGLVSWFSQKPHPRRSSR